MVHTIYPLVSYLCRNEEFSLLLCTSGQRLCTAEGHTSSIKDVVWMPSNDASEYDYMCVYMYVDITRGVCSRSVRRQSAFC